MRSQSVQIRCCKFVSGDSTSGGQLCGSLEATGRLLILEDVQKASSSSPLTLLSTLVDKLNTLRPFTIGCLLPALYADTYWPHGGLSVIDKQDICRCCRKNGNVFRRLYYYMKLTWFRAI